jgi:GNAT superfamily N-acetyltransferase
MAVPLDAGLRIDALADHADLVRQIAAWHWNEWGHGDPRGSLSSWTAGLAGRLGRDTVPATYIALHDHAPVGSVSLVDQDMATHPDLGPWLAGLYVEPAWRGRGIAGRLIARAVERAEAMGLPCLYLYTTTAVGLYRRFGWEAAFEERYGDELVTVMRRPVRAHRFGGAANR